MTACMCALSYFTPSTRQVYRPVIPPGTLTTRSTDNVDQALPPSSNKKLQVLVLGIGMVVEKPFQNDENDNNKINCGSPSFLERPDENKE
jgi:hypothetical protein